MRVAAIIVSMVLRTNVVLAGITYAISLFFWPTPAVPLVAVILW